MSPATIGSSQRSCCSGVPKRCSMIASCIVTLPTANWPSSERPMISLSVDEVQQRDARRRRSPPGGRAPTARAPWPPAFSRGSAASPSASAGMTTSSMNSRMRARRSIAHMPPQSRPPARDQPRHAQPRPDAGAARAPHRARLRGRPDVVAERQHRPRRAGEGRSRGTCRRRSRSEFGVDTPVIVRTARAARQGRRGQPVPGRGRQGAARPLPRRALPGGGRRRRWTASTASGASPAARSTATTATR